MKSTPKNLMNSRYGTGTWANVVALLDTCRDLEAEGHRIENVSRTQLAAASGVTANNEIAAGKQLYKKRREILNDLPQTPTEVAEILLRSVNAEFARMGELFQAKSSEQETAFEEALAASSHEYSQLSDSYERLKAQHESSSEEISNLQQQIQHLRQRNEMLVEQKAQAEELLQVTEASREQCRSLLRKRRRQIRQAEEKHRSDQAQHLQTWKEQKSELVEANKKALDLLSLELETARQERKTSETKFRDEISDLQQELADRKRALRHQTDQSVKLSMECDEIRRQLQESSTKNLHLAEDLGNRRKECDRLAKSAESLQIENDLLRTQATQLKSLSVVLASLEKRLEKENEGKKRNQ